MKKLRILIQFEPDQLAALRKLHVKTGAPIAELVRRAVAAYLKAMEKKK